MKTATEQLIELAERLNPTGVIGDGMVAEFHALAARARGEQSQMRGAIRDIATAEPIPTPPEAFAWCVGVAKAAERPPCYGSEPDEQAFAENDCGSCVVAHACLDI